MTLTDDAYKLSSTSFPSGVVTLHHPAPARPQRAGDPHRGQAQIVSEQENIGPGFLKLTTSLQGGHLLRRLQKPNMVGELQGRHRAEDFKGAVDISADEAKARGRRHQLHRLRPRPDRPAAHLHPGLRLPFSGDTDTARPLPAARQYYERIEPTARSSASRRAGDLDAAGRRVQDLAAGAGRPSPTRTSSPDGPSWHRIGRPVGPRTPPAPSNSPTTPPAGRSPTSSTPTPKSLSSTGIYHRRQRTRIRARAGKGTPALRVASSKIVGEEGPSPTPTSTTSRPTSGVPGSPTATSRLHEEEGLQARRRSPASSRRLRSSSRTTSPGRPPTASPPGGLLHRLGPEGRRRDPEQKRKFSMTPSTP